MDKIKAVEFDRDNYSVSVIAIFESGNVSKIFSYYDDEISFTADELIGKTEEEALQIKYKKDIAYLRS